MRRDYSVEQVSLPRFVHACTYLAEVSTELAPVGSIIFAQLKPSTRCDESPICGRVKCCIRRKCAAVVPACDLTVLEREEDPEAYFEW